MAASTIDENLETYSLIWLDASVNNSKENLKVQQQLRACINHLLTFEDEQQCLQHLKSIPKDDRIVLIVSGSLGRSIVPQIVSLRQIIAIYIYCMDLVVNKKWSQSIVKVKGVHVRLDDLIKQIKNDQIQREHCKLDETLPISFSIPSEQTSTELNGQFIHFQLLIDCLIRMDVSINEMEEFIVFCRQYLHDNAKQLQVVEEFEKQYTSERSIWWYTREIFLYRLMNRALRRQDIDKLYLFRFFIRDMGIQLEQHKCSSSVRVYRAQYTHQGEIEMLHKSIGEYISMNSFLSTSLVLKQALGFFDLNPSSDGVEKVLFEMDANPQLANIKPFANVKKFSFHPGEDEVLFMIGSIFRIIEVKRDKDGMWNIRMELCTVNDRKLQELLQHMKNDLGTGKTNLLQFSHVLYKMGKLNDAEKYAQWYLNRLSEKDSKRAACYQVLGAIADDKGDLDLSLKWYIQTLEIDTKTEETDSSDVANIHNCMAIVYTKKGDYKQALSSYEKALKIWKKNYSENDPHVAMCLNNMGSVYQNENNYSKALDCHEKALTILKNRLPADHSDLGGLYNNIGTIHQCLGDHDQALEQFNLSLRIFKKSLPANHPDIAMTLMNMGNSYEEKGDFRQAFTYINGAIEILRQSFPPTSPEMIQLDQSIKRLSSKLK